jgi:hypothetical protein
MITKKIAQNARRGQIFHHVTNSMRVRVTGKCKVWVTRPSEFRLPVKYGLYDSGYVD